EACDDDDLDAGDGCGPTCAVEAGYSCAGAPSMCSTTCGDGIIAGAEACDDDDLDAGDGCGPTCAIEAGFSCAGAPSVCATTCGDGIIAGAEVCDDDNAASSDGCSAACAIELGWQCAGSPSACSTICGDGLKLGGEACDDGDKAPLDGCSAACTTETGWQCVGSPSICSTICGDGIKLPPEACDDGNPTAGDGCTPSCFIEPGYQCAGSPSMCAGICGDGAMVANEGCDDGDNSPLDGCNAICMVEAGWQCAGSPSACSAICGDGTKVGPETCDDGGTAAGDGCNPACLIEVGWQCSGVPSACSTICGDGILRGAEACDDGDTAGSDGCGPTCIVEAGWQCAGSPSACSAICGDGIKVGPEACDDGGTAAADGCSPACSIEMGWQCSGSPSACSAICGDGILLGGEACDDGDTAGLDGCGPTCIVEAGWQCSGSPSACSAICGDEIVVGSEVCDGMNLGGQTCLTVGFDAGPLACKADCTFDTSNCLTFEDCNDGVDNDNDAIADCADPDCAADPICSSGNEAVCNNFDDEDSDGLTDCEDPSSCKSLAICAPGNTPVGGPCDVPHDCVSSTQTPVCIDAATQGFPGGYCSSFCSSSPGCGAGALCMPVIDIASDAGLCLDTCTSSANCRAGYVCSDFGYTSKVCWPDQPFTCGDDELTKPPAEPYYMIVFDTSGSTLTALGTANSCGFAATRNGHARCGVRQAVQAYQWKYNFGLASFAVTQSSCSGACFSNCQLNCFQAELTTTGMCVGCGAKPGNASTRAGANIVVPMRVDKIPAAADNVPQILSWMDNNCTGSTELFAQGNAPLNGALRDMYRYFSSSWIDTNGVPLSSPLTSVALGEKPCRPVEVILLIDGGDTCDLPSDAVAAAAALYAGFTKDGITWSVKTHVIDFGNAGVEADQIAAAGGTGSAQHVTTDAQIAQAIGNILKGGPYPSEACDGLDNNCNGCVDEGGCP
ncbi:MAG: DUF4215 domain-containing protein, partial [Polyangiaceae bacterium]|nr:DUF4215 domain-containing protein [Polyangiaceae bacterium]